MTIQDPRQLIRQIVVENARLATSMSEIDDDSDLFALGMSSHASVNLMLALEESFSIEFPGHMLKKATFSSVAAIETAVSELTEVNA
ncbi:MAG: acyl carrier protein [Acidimicrobiales bacterium]